ncbi:MAG: response regulator [Myxococcaceae bacterium]
MASSPVPAEKKKLILVSDSEKTLVESLFKIAETLDLVVTSDAPDKVLTRAKADKPDLVVLDVNHKDGLELLSMLKSGLSTRETPVVVVARGEGMELREMALEIGADAFVTKPLGPDFLAKVAAFLHGRKG